MSDCECRQNARELEGQRRLLGLLLGLNGLMFAVEGSLGLLAQSTGLIADALDMLADASVYGLALYAVGRSETLKNRAAALSGGAQLLLALAVIAEVLRRTVYGSEPQSLLMMATAALALAVNLTCLTLLNRHRHGEIHLRASWLFSASDVLANLGVIAAGLLVAWTGTPWPDLVIGALIAGVVARTGIRIIRESRAGTAAD
ncbi:cation diffusion facilitator family transporter [Motiliproteus sp. SC1-56]|uniref:cation diffusion facilitator family transporter n=1 Tax=Motiliproteus sp. SC1-56 TaxID=2799565 RepID=UPI001A8FA27E|nr:cation diffusion facilitator family transporter [Motiliproteus sp. SC1-56]